MLATFMRSSYRGLVVLLGVGLSCAGRSTPAPAPQSSDAEFVGFITDTECGPDHSQMMLKGGTKTAPDCTRKCVSEGSTYAFVSADRKRFYQLDDQDAPGPYAGLKVRIRGHLQGDTIFVRSIAPAD
jgi:hypothetical protein